MKSMNEKEKITDLYFFMFRTFLVLQKVITFRFSVRKMLVLSKVLVIEICL